MTQARLHAGDAVVPTGTRPSLAIALVGSGGEAAAMIRIATHPVECMAGGFDALAGVDWENVHRFAAEIPHAADALVVGDPEQGEPPPVYMQHGARFEPLPLGKIAKGVPGWERAAG